MFLTRKRINRLSNTPISLPKERIGEDRAGLVRYPARPVFIPERTEFKKKRKRTPLILHRVEGMPGLFAGKLKDGRNFKVRENRDRWFYPEEWMKFYDKLKNRQKMTFEVLIHTGARYNEAFNIRVGDCDLDRGNILLRVTKRKGTERSRTRTISISTKFAKKLALYIRQRKLTQDDCLGILKRPAAHMCLKNTLKRIGVKDYYMFGLHNVRKTHGNWLKALGVDSTEIASRLGHNTTMFLQHYASPNIFNYKDLSNMRLILGDLYQK